ncbi:condensation domain-containing protein [Cellulomonas palmilytica]|uniref:condensation domain-containing protein n=1 Tax=Cellulomonas palmilytica TaxID=2608402 RepID=UPI001F32E412|nr:condensation domain-containing protein [Cellulomonas palmilytica]UJP40689.1 hypothetical protein F1D97_04090 [Cellulomonas palmilytica]
MSSRLIPLLPNQAWFLAELATTMVSPSRWNLARFLDLPSDVTGDQVRRAVEAAWQAHESLRARVVRTASGWQQDLRDRDEPMPFRVIDVAHVPPSEREALIIRVGGEIRASSLDLESGRLVDITLFRGGPEDPCRLLLVVHHLLADVQSLRLVVADIETALAAILRGDDPPPPRAETLEACVAGFHTYVDTFADDDLEIWARDVEPAATLPALPCSPSAIHTWTVRSHDVTLDGLADVGRASGTGRPDDPELALLAGVGSAVTEAADGPVWVKTMTHGRTLRSPDGRSLLPAGARRTVAFFSTAGLFQLKPRDGRGHGAYAADLAARVAEQPNRALAPGLVRWLRPDGQRPALVDEAARATVLLFNYRSKARSAAAARIVSSSPFSAPGGEDALEPRPPLVVDGLLEAGRVRVGWSFDPYRFDSDLAAQISSSAAADARNVLADATHPVPDHAVAAQL